MGCGSSVSVPSVAPVSTNSEEYFAYTGKEVWYTCHADVALELRCAKVGIASAEGCPPRTLPQMLQQAAEKAPDLPALKLGPQVWKAEKPCPALEGNKAPPALKDDQWTTWTWKQYYEDAKKAGKGFIKLGLERFESVAVWGFNSPEWMLTSVAAAMAGGKTAGLYPTDSHDTAAFKVVHSGASIVIVEDRTKLERLVPALESRAYAGKAVMMSHDNVIFESTSVMSVGAEHMGFCQKAEQERILSYLPLSHIAGLMVDIVFPIVATATSPAHVTTYFARPYDLKAGSLKDRLCAARPTCFLGVPLVWEKAMGRWAWAVADKLRTLGANNPGWKKSLAGWAKKKGLSRAKGQQLGGNGQAPCCYGLANKVVLSKVKAQLGLDKVKFGITGAAPIRVDTLEYFGSLGLQINEVYGMSESTAACTISTSKIHQWGSCGFQLPGMEVKAFKVGSDINQKTECPRAPNLENTDEDFQGELCFRGRSGLEHVGKGIMMGYMAQRELGLDHVREIEKKTADTIDKDGWLHSGDKGIVTASGMVKVTGRYKEIIIGAGGENIAPVPIEDHIKACCDGINEVIMVGDKQKYNVALAVGANGETPGTDKLDAGALRVNQKVKTITEALDDEVWIDQIKLAIDKTNSNAKVCHNNAFKIQKFMILPTNFSEEQGFLTPTKKMKRPVVEKAFGKQIEMMYNSEDVYVRYKE
eukprot:Skav230624  [mRNA]  locus=scaffold1673:115570:126501:+ [translate_table: standard]